MLSGTLDDMPAQEREQWERRGRSRGPLGNRDALRALEYLGPAENNVAKALDIKGDGLVDLADVMEISRYADESRGRAPRGEPRHGRAEKAGAESLVGTHKS